MPARYPFLRLVSPLAALATLLALVGGLGALVVLPVVGLFHGSPITSLVHGVVWGTAGLAAAFAFAVVGEVAELLLHLARCVGQATEQNASAGSASTPVEGHPE